MADRVITNRRFRLLMKQAGMKAIELVKGYGFFYIISADRETEERIMSLWESSIYVNNFHELTPERWVREIQNLFKEPINNLQQ